MQRFFFKNESICISQSILFMLFSFDTALQNSGGGGSAPQLPPPVSMPLSAVQDY